MTALRPLIDHFVRAALAGGLCLLAAGATAQPETPAGPTPDTPARLLSDYLQLPSVSGEEGPAGRFLADWCRTRGLHVRVFTEADSNYNFAASLYPLTTGRPNVVLLHHIDVVSPGEERHWEELPYSGKVRADTIWGRGAIDAKGLGVMQAFATAAFVPVAAKQPLPYNVTVLAVSGEEVGSRGTRVLVRDYLDELNAAVVFGEGGGGFQNAVPSDPAQAIFGVSVAEKSTLWLKLQLRFESFGHGATPPSQYVNKTMLRALARLYNAERGLEFIPLTRQMFRQVGELEGGVLGFAMKHVSSPLLRPFVRKYFRSNPLQRALVSNTVTITNISNPPGPPNVISDAATVYLDCRLLPGTNQKKFIRDIRQGLFEPRFKVEILEQSARAAPTQPDDFYDALAVALREEHPGAEVMPILFPASTDNNAYRQAGIPTYGLFPMLMSEASMKMVHNFNERIAVADLESGVRVYHRMLSKLLDVPLPSQSADIEP